MNKHQISMFYELNGASQSNVMELLRCATLDPGHHVIRANQSGVKARPYGYRVELPKHNPSCTQVNATWDLGYWLLHNGFVRHGDVPWKTFRFNDDVIAWYLETHPLSETEERAIVGKYFYELAVSDDELNPFDLDRAAEKVGLRPDRVQIAVRALHGAKIIHDDGPGGSGIPPYFKLSQDGYRWAINGYRADLGSSPSIDVNVNLHVEIEQVISTIARLEIPEEQRKFYQLSVRKLEQELQQGKPSWSTVKEALDVAASTKEVAIPIVTLLARYGEQIQQAISQLPVI